MDFNRFKEVFDESFGKVTPKEFISGPNKIIWTEQNKFFGLDHSTKKGISGNFKFDIRYDSDGDYKVKPKCGLTMCVYFKEICIESSLFGTMNDLTKYAESYDWGK